MLNNKFLFFRNIAIDKKGKKKDFIKKCFLDISNIFKREFPHYFLTFLKENFLITVVLPFLSLI
ncbi:MAG: hypothetical protein AMS24_05465 [Chlamydiae bacterium SM23_39]|nr:MAG: hypothetical protein AMS24_05465 [Chlamydiae bacterium SM23_39]